MILETCRSITEQKEFFCKEVIDSLVDTFPRSVFDHNKCIRDLSLILDSVVADLSNGSTDRCTIAGMSYVYSYNGLIFTYQKAQTLYAINELKDIVLSITPVEDRVQVEIRFNVIIDIVSDKTIKEVKWWDFAGRVVPFVALAILALTHLLDSTQLYHLSIIIIILAFFTTGVVWWWWSIYKIANIIIKIRQAQYKFNDVKEQLLKLKTEIQGIRNDRSRQRGKSEEC